MDRMRDDNAAIQDVIGKERQAPARRIKMDGTSSKK
jgi:hypothetical protein